MNGSFDETWDEIPDLPYIGEYEPEIDIPYNQISSDAFVDALSIRLKKKCLEIKKFLQENDNNLHLHKEQLRKFAISPGGLILDEYREKIWPILARYYPSDLDYFKNDDEDDDSDLEYDTVSSTCNIECDDEYIEPTIEMLQLHKDWKQVQLDVNRTLERFPPFIDEENRKKLMKELTPFIIRILSRNKKFHYYQGFHDVCLTIVLAVGLDIGYQVCKSLTRKGVFSKYLKKTLEESVLKELELMFPIFFKRSKIIDKTLKESNMTCIFALSWPLTWLSHSLQNYKHIVLCFDFFLSSHSLMPIYLSSALILSREEEIRLCEKDMGLLYGVLNKIPKNCRIPEIIAEAQNLFDDYPPMVLRKRIMNEYLLDRKTPIPRPKKPISRDSILNNINLLGFVGFGSALILYFVYQYYSNVLSGY
ncbi:TBC1 domain family member 20 [Strongyloides ratti]|uniref:TBC1 domain family member 20 n=1 Tax=Strongyloides ratti TaxID=34506 RepID=A0A090LM50_STRRB|nr:TBC1 domain family member 20 [Strongyloides ratti]CEF70801.1 TBC1 domain family member 20 [Strongyloides ratti]